MSEELIRKESRTSLRAMAPMKKEGHPFALTVGAALFALAVYLTWGNVWTAVLAHSSSFYSNNSWLYWIIESEFQFNSIVLVAALIPVLCVCIFLGLIIQDFVTAPGRRKAREQLLEQARMRNRLN
jgi:branched-subunit amino acid ABC-type transport system permease component